MESHNHGFVLVAVCLPLVDGCSWLFETSWMYVCGCLRWTCVRGCVFSNGGCLFVAVRDYVDVCSWLIKTSWMCVRRCVFVAVQNFVDMCL